ncbi:FecCD family ABC transporter permease [Rhizobium helianthi]|uniref:FecCD family ABC transporter permease n=1 Tax=Rhizobium helianthi TaxID=1132695 RepID=A0ABW4M0D0_9HYPH
MVPAAFRLWRVDVGGDRSRIAAHCLLALVLLLAIAIAVSLAVGATGVSLPHLWLYLTGHGQTLSLQDRVVLEAVRLPRTALAILVGAGLALSGAMMQSLFRNPLADPGIVGVTSGAALFAIIAIVLGSGPLAALSLLFGNQFVPLMAFTGSLLNTWLLYRIATVGGQTHASTLILAGIAVGAMSAAVMGLLIYIADDRQLRDITFWSLGSLSGATWPRVLSVAPLVLLVVGIIPTIARGLDALVLGDAAAFHMGIRVQRLKRLVIVAIAAACGATVAAAGSIGFVGIVVPHLLRLVMGPSHRFLLPASAMGGAALLLFADSIARVMVAPAELPIGIITALLGAPVFLALIFGRRRTLNAGVGP